jgi:outer membrane protein assembly factor BamB
MLRTTCCVLASTVTLTVLGASPQSESWSRFRGQMGSGIATARDLPDELSVDRTLLWRVDLPPGKSSPVIAGSRLFLTAWEGDRRLVICLDRATGRRLWEAPVVKQYGQVANRLNDPAAPTVAVDGENVYAFFAEAGLVSFDARGHQRWAVPLGPFASVHGVASSPIFAEGLVVQAIEQQAGGSWLSAYDAATGALRWRTTFDDIGQQGYSTPFVYTPPAGPAQIVMSRSGEIGGWSLADGRPVWWVRGTGTQVYSLPAVSDTMMFASADGDTVEGALQAWEEWLQKANRTEERTLRVNQDFPGAVLERADRTFGNDDGLLDEQEWRHLVRNNRPRGLVAVRLGGTGDVSDSHVLWRTARSIPLVASPISYENILYYVRDGGIFSALESATGAVLKEGRLEGAADKYFASLVAGDGKIYLASEGGKLVVIRAGPDWSVLSTSDLGEELYATPAISEEGRIYVRSARALYCFGRAAEKDETR